ncbi:MAG TPA: TetR/AcrR family transcriptional regulator [Acidimicrobiales bacterium]
MTRRSTPRPSRPGRPRGPRRDRDERRAELLDAAERAIRRIGPRASMDEIAAEAGVTKPILYAHFGDKAGLVSALAARVAARIDSAVSEALSREDEPSVVVASTIEAFCAFVENESHLYRFLVQSAKHGTDVSGPRLVSDISSRIAVVLGGALRRAGADSGPAEPWAAAIVGMAFGGATWWVERRSMSRADLVDYLSRLLWSGLSGAGLDALERAGGPPPAQHDADRAHIRAVPEPHATGGGRAG